MSENRQTIVLFVLGSVAAFEAALYAGVLAYMVWPEPWFVVAVVTVGAALVFAKVDSLESSAPRYEVAFVNIRRLVVSLFPLVLLYSAMAFCLSVVRETITGPTQASC